MKYSKWFVGLAVLFCGVIWFASGRIAAEQPKPAAPSPATNHQPLTTTLTLAHGEHVAIIGNTLADRMQHFGGLETLLQARFPRR